LLRQSFGLRGCSLCPLRAIPSQPRLKTQRVTSSGNLRDLEAEGARAENIRQLLHADAGFSALTVSAGTRRLIVYNQRHPPDRRANSLAHELSHIILEHLPAPALDESGSRLWGLQ